MVTDKHKFIKGYRDLTQREIDCINDIKLKAEEVKNLLILIEAESLVDKRWLSIARTDLQKGFMAAVRAIAQPTSF